MAISVDMFCKTYKANSKAKDKTFEDFIKKHITTKYISFIQKNVYCTSIVYNSCHKKDGDREFIEIDSVMRYMHFIMRLIDLYTDIEITPDTLVEDYDKLNEIGAIETLIAAIPESEYAEFSTILNMKLDDFRENEYSLTALLYNLKESFSLSEEIITSALETITKENNSN